jgi:hypothetical protein
VNEDSRVYLVVSSLLMVTLSPILLKNMRVRHRCYGMNGHISGTPTEKYTVSSGKSSILLSRIFA